MPALITASPPLAADRGRGVRSSAWGGQAASHTLCLDGARGMSRFRLAGRTRLPEGLTVWGVLGQRQHRLCGGGWIGALPCGIFCCASACAASNIVTRHGAWTRLGDNPSHSWASAGPADAATALSTAEPSWATSRNTWRISPIASRVRERPPGATALTLIGDVTLPRACRFDAAGRLSFSADARLLLTDQASPPGYPTTVYSGHGATGGSPSWL